MEDYRLQTVLLHQIKKKGFTNIEKLFKEVLGLTKSSAYRRVRGETTLALDEAYKLCKHCGITLENIIAKTEGQVVINMASVDKAFETHLDYPKYLLKILRYITSLPAGEIIYLTNEIPVCYFFTSPLMAAFKMYVWGRNTFHQEALAERQFQPDLLTQDPEFKDICWEMITLYEQIIRTEVWTTGVLKRSLSQIAYCESAGLFENKKTAENLRKETDAILKKTLSPQPHFTKSANRRHLYYQPFFSAEDIILIKTDGKPKQVISTFFNPDYFISDDSRLLSRSTRRLDFLLSKSELVVNENSFKTMRKVYKKGMREAYRTLQPTAA